MKKKSSPLPSWILCPPKNYPTLEDVVKDVFGLVIFNADDGGECGNVGLRIKLPKFFALTWIFVVPRALLDVSIKFCLHCGLGGGAARQRVSRVKRLGDKGAPQRRKRSFLRPMWLDSNRQTSAGSLLHAGGKRAPPGRRRLTARLSGRRDIGNAGLFVNVGRSKERKSSNSLSWASGE